MCDPEILQSVTEMQLNEIRKHVATMEEDLKRIRSLTGSLLVAVIALLLWVFATAMIELFAV
jgi:hypothetical protein